MGGLNTRRLLVPAVLSVTAIVGCPAGDDGGGASSSTTTEDTSDTSTVTATSSSTMSSTATDSSGSSEASSGDEASGTGTGPGTSTGGSGGETGGIPTCTDLPDEPSCAEEAQCIFLPELGGCIRNCEMIEDLEVCEQSPGCIVFDNTCGYEPVE